MKSVLGEVMNGRKTKQKQKKAQMKSLQEERTRKSEIILVRFKIDAVLNIAHSRLNRSEKYFHLYVCKENLTYNSYLV